jgi:hypothetical protein
VVLRSRRGTEMAPAFPEIVAGAVQVPDATAMDGELVVWDAGRLAFERLQNRLQHRGAGAARAAVEWPAHFVAFDLLRLSRSVLHASDCEEAAAGAPLLDVDRALDAAEHPGTRLRTLCGAAQELTPLLRGFDHITDSAPDDS